MTTVKGMLLGAVLTFVLALIMGHGGSSGGVVAIAPVHFQQYTFFWSWPLFFVSSAGATGILTLMK